MPVKECSIDGRPGFKWGDEGKCYTYDPNDRSSKERARSKAVEQGRAQIASARSSEAERRQEREKKRKRPIFVPRG